MVSLLTNNGPFHLFCGRCNIFSSYRKTLVLISECTCSRQFRLTLRLVRKSMLFYSYMSHFNTMIKLIEMYRAANNYCFQYTPINLISSHDVSVQTVSLPFRYKMLFIAQQQFSQHNVLRYNVCSMLWYYIWDNAIKVEWMTRSVAQCSKAINTQCGKEQKTFLEVI